MCNCKPSTVARFECQLARHATLYSSLPGSGLPVFTFSCVYVSAFPRVHIRQCLVACTCTMPMYLATG